jgi:hypothetical protein
MDTISFLPIHTYIVPTPAISTAPPQNINTEDQDIHRTFDTNLAAKSFPYGPTYNHYFTTKPFTYTNVSTPTKPLKSPPPVKDEYDALIENKIRDLVSRPSNANVI